MTDYQIRMLSFVWFFFFNQSKNNAFPQPRAGHFRRPLEAKDLSFEAKDLKMCPRGRPRGQGRPLGLHLCLYTT